MKLEEFKYRIQNYSLDDAELNFVLKLIKLVEAVRFAEESTWFGEFEERSSAVSEVFEELEKD